MGASHQLTRMDTQELKEVISKKIGQQRAKKYFNALRSFLSQQLSKVEFDKVCKQTIGRENIPLHNRLIKSILMNVCLGKVPPPVPTVETPLSIKVTNSYQRSSVEFLSGNVFSGSPRKSRSPRGRKFHDRQSPLGKSPGTVCNEGAVELISLGSRPPVEVASVEEGEEVEQTAGSPSIQSRSPVTAPFGVSVKVGGPRKALRVGNPSTDYITPTTHGILPDSRSLRSLLQKRLEQEGIGVSLDCANVLNNGLDVFLKRLIEPCMGLARSHNIVVGPNGIFPSAYLQKQAQETRVSMLDFRVAMKLNPHVLGEEWPTQLEMMSTMDFERLLGCRGLSS